MNFDLMLSAWLDAIAAHHKRAIRAKAAHVRRRLFGDGHRSAA